MPLASRFSNLKPISEFFDFKRLSKPSSFGEAQSRASYNLGYFSSNYAVVVLMLSIYSLLTNLLLLFVILLVVGGMWGIGRLAGRDLTLGKFTLFIVVPRHHWDHSPWGSIGPSIPILAICLSRIYKLTRLIDCRAYSRNHISALHDASCGRHPARVPIVSDIRNHVAYRI